MNKWTDDAWWSHDLFKTNRSLEYVHKRMSQWKFDFWTTLFLLMYFLIVNHQLLYIYLLLMIIQHQQTNCTYNNYKKTLDTYIVILMYLLNQWKNKSWNQWTQNLYFDIIKLQMFSLLPVRSQRKNDRIRFYWNCSNRSKHLWRCSMFVRVSIIA